jgi:hypothetical protein
MQAKQLKVWELPDLGADETYKIDLKPYPKGVYQLEVRMGAWVQVRTVVKG